MNEPVGAPTARGRPAVRHDPGADGDPLRGGGVGGGRTAISTRMLPTAGPPAAMYGGMPERRIPE